MSKFGDKIEVEVSNGVCVKIPLKLLETSIKLNPASLQNYVHDLLMLDEINEANILYNIRN